ncbi:MAG: hypothetical protein JSR33_04990 [Proteobacteria bacterium]|nr:hypothetical protein [Pseudomonadota bacterium]
MISRESVPITKKTEGTSRFATLPLQLQLQIKRYLQLGDFRAAKALFDAGLNSEEKH